MLSSLLRLAAFLLLLPWISPHAAEHCVVLRYQHVNERTPGLSSVTPRQFERHLALLAEEDYRVMPLTDVVERLRDGAGVPSRCVALTVDGPFASLYDTVFPRVQQYGFPLTVFVNTGLVDSARDDVVGWARLRDMRAAGIDIQSLGHSPIHLLRREPGESVDDWAQRVAFDIQLAQSRLREELGVEATLFAYPFGEYDRELQEILGSMGLSAFGLHAGAVWTQADFTALPRFPMASFGARERPFRKKIDAHPLPIAGAFPLDPVITLDDWQPSLTLVFQPDVARPQRLRCLLNGAPGMRYQWLDQPENAVLLMPAGRLRVGRNRIDCTLPLADGTAEGWYSHLWIRRADDGGWYREADPAWTLTPSTPPRAESRPDRPGAAATP
jgi:peptidoglycan/xylan/chitin deacetylase (PgdA/CDA1 family)